MFLLSSLASLCLAGKSQAHRKVEYYSSRPALSHFTVPWLVWSGLGYRLSHFKSTLGVVGRYPRILQASTSELAPISRPRTHISLVEGLRKGLTPGASQPTGHHRPFPIAATLTGEKKKGKKSQIAGNDKN